jgi:cytochrome bd-type quinol oxidase subunit 1
MTIYSTNSDKKDNSSKQPVHPVWSGIGCALMIILPIISYIAGDYFVSNAELYKWVVIPPELVKDIFKDHLILVKLLYTAIFIAIMYLLLIVITVFVNKFFGPSRYGPYDIPLDKVERKK